mmetsp:Transcript_14156/g.33464  ORF Transcript_14156/g.33464 Transcript_14156/m.33464 type:complete len:211 (+) Transcript_14156:500-1132(+)
MDAAGRRRPRRRLVPRDGHQRRAEYARRHRGHRRPDGQRQGQDGRPRAHLPLGRGARQGRRARARLGPQGPGARRRGGRHQRFLRPPHRQGPHDHHRRAAVQVEAGQGPCLLQRRRRAAAFRRLRARGGRRRGRGRRGRRAYAYRQCPPETRRALEQGRGAKLCRRRLRTAKELWQRQGTRAGRLPLRVPGRHCAAGEPVLIPRHLARAV